MSFQRQIVHIDLDSFFVSVERKFDPSLIGKAVIIGGSADRGVVASCSYEARAFGVHSAMPTRQALKLCPHAILIRGSHGRYGEASREVTDIIHNAVPLYQKTSVDEFYIDYTGMDRYHNAYQHATELRQKIIKDTAGGADQNNRPAHEAANIVHPGSNTRSAGAVCAGPKRLAFTRTETAEMLGIKPITVDRLTKRGLLRPSRATRRPLYAECELMRFLRETSK